MTLSASHFMHLPDRPSTRAMPVAQSRVAFAHGERRIVNAMANYHDRRAVRETNPIFGRNGARTIGLWRGWVVGPPPLRFSSPPPRPHPTWQIYPTPAAAGAGGRAANANIFYIV